MAEKNITWHNAKVNREQRETRNQHKAAVIWITGLSASGKSTITTELERQLFEERIHTYRLDGDNMRHGLNADLDFSEDSRRENIRRAGEVAKLFFDAGCIVIAGFISPYKKDRDSIRRILPEGRFIEVYLECSVEECEKRDPKGLYTKARSGEIQNFTGISAPYELPEHAELIINTKNISVEHSVDLIKEYLKKNSFI